MKVIIIAACLSIISLQLVQEDRGWRGIVPLRSTRADVERVLGAWDSKCECYTTANEIVHVDYSSEPCKGFIAGWNVPANTVLSFRVTPNESVLFSEMKVSKDALVKTADDAGYIHYGNGDKGIRYLVSWEGKLASTWYGPSVSDNKLRCAGFPPTDGGVTAYKPFYEFRYATVEDVERFGAFGVRLVKERGIKGYVIIYGGPDKNPAVVENLITTSKNYLIGELNVDSKTLEVIHGGYRQEPTAELFLLPREWPRPIATPTLAGPAKE